MTPASRPTARLLSVVVLILIAVLPAKIGVLWSVAAVVAQAEEAPNSAESAPEPSNSTLPSDVAAASPKDSNPLDNSVELVENRSLDRAVEPFDPLTLTTAEIDVLRQLAKRRDELATREAALKDRELLLMAAEKRIAAQIKQLQELQATVVDKSGAESEASPLQRLVVVYEAMKPEDAARIFEVMDGAVLIEVAERMAERRLAPVLAQMTANKAQALTVALAHRRSVASP